MTGTRSYFRRPYRILTPAYCTRCDGKMQRVTIEDKEDLALYCCPKCEPKVEGRYKAEMER